MQLKPLPVGSEIGRGRLMKTITVLLVAGVVLSGPADPAQAQERSPLRAAADRVFRAWDEGRVEIGGYRRDLALEALLRLSIAGAGHGYREAVLDHVSANGPAPGRPVSYRVQPFNVLTFELYRATEDRRWLAGFLDESRRYRAEVPRTAEGAMTHPRGERRGGTAG